MKYLTRTYEEGDEFKNHEHGSFKNLGILFVVLVGSDKSVNHSVSMCQGWIFDGNEEYGLKLNADNLGLCCSTPETRVEFVKFAKAIYFYPAKKNPICRKLKKITNTL